MKIFLFTVVCFIFSMSTIAQMNKPGVWWRARLQRQDGVAVVFNFERKQERGGEVWYIRNAGERMKVTDIDRKGDSLIVQMPVFESQFRLLQKDKLLEGVWIKAGSLKTQEMPITAVPGKERFAVKSSSQQNISGRWAVTFTNSLNLSSPSVAEFRQTGDIVTGTFLNPTGDYRYLEGVIDGDSLFLSGFDGSHAFLFTARIGGDELSGGRYYSGATSRQTWTAKKDASASLPAGDVEMYLRPGEEKLDFTFNDLEGKPVSINDERYKNKVVVIQLMGSWCPNCMDETAFLSSYYNKNKTRGVEIISLAYEYSADTARASRSLRKFQKQFNVQYAMLNTGVTVSDTLRTQKTLPQLTPIRMFPSSIIIDKKSRVRKLDTGFNGPATGKHYIDYVNAFHKTIDELLAEK